MDSIRSARTVRSLPRGTKTAVRAVKKTGISVSENLKLTFRSDILYFFNKKIKNNNFFVL
jgi:hypothetical protein